MCPGTDEHSWSLIPAWLCWHCCLAGVSALCVSSWEEQHFFGTAVKFCIITDFKVTSVVCFLFKNETFPLYYQGSQSGELCA